MIAAVLGKLSERAGRTYRPDTAAHAGRVLRLLREGYSETDLRTVVWGRANAWEGDAKMSPYLRPSTVFGPQKFPEYLAEDTAAWEAGERADAERGRLKSVGLGTFLRGVSS